VYDRALGREVALKVLGPAAPVRDGARRLEVEAHALARLEHPGIVPVYDVGRLADDRLFYTMKLVHGRRLDERARAGLSLGEAVRIVVKLCDAVAFAHDRHVIHRDLKPQNVMIAPYGEVLILDWGVAKVRDADVQATPTPAGALETPRQGEGTQDGVVLGTPGYMAPEQAAGHGARADARTDVYALGVMLRELALAALGDGTMPPPLASIAARATAPHAADRYATAGALGDDLSRFLDGEQVQAHRETLGERVRRLAGRHRVALALILVYVLVRAVMLAAL
jgi:serine/threonine protein kinase